jgi:hypothetical protein
MTTRTSIAPSNIWRDAEAQHRRLDVIAGSDGGAFHSQSAIPEIGPYVAFLIWAFGLHFIGIRTNQLVKGEMAMYW